MVDLRSHLSENTTESKLVFVHEEAHALSSMH